jgi:hypothetical protein
MIHAFLITLAVLAAIFVFPLIPAILCSRWFWKLVLVFIIGNLILVALGIYDWTQQRQQARLLDRQYEQTLRQSSFFLANCTSKEIVDSFRSSQALGRNGVNYSTTK